MLCPQCQTELEIDRQPNGALWLCHHCSGVAANLAVLRKQLPPRIVRDFWKQAYSSKKASRLCPSCRQALNNFSCTFSGNTINLDLCKKCQIVWFDKDELDAFPKIVAQTEDLSPEAKEQLALYRVQYRQELPESTILNQGKFYFLTKAVITIIEILIRIALR